MENAEAKIYAVVKVSDYEISIPEIFESYDDALSFYYAHEKDPDSYAIYETVMHTRGRNI